MKYKKLVATLEKVAEQATADLEGLDTGDRRAVRDRLVLERVKRNAENLRTLLERATATE